MKTKEDLARAVDLVGFYYLDLNISMEEIETSVEFKLVKSGELFSINLSDVFPRDVFEVPKSSSPDFSDVELSSRDQWELYHENEEVMKKVLIDAIKRKGTTISVFDSDNVMECEILK